MFIKIIKFMEKKEIFMFLKVLAQNGLTKDDCIEFFKKRCRRTSLPILYYYPQKEVFSSVASISEEKAPNAIGVVLNEKTVMLLQAVYEINKDENIETYLKEKFPYYLNVRGAKKSDIKTIFDNQDAIFSTLCELENCGCDTSFFNFSYCGWIDNDRTTVDLNGKKVDLQKYLKTSNLLIFADFPH